MKAVTRVRGLVGLASLVAGGSALLLALPASGSPASSTFPAPRSTEEARVELGRRLFFDPIASRSGERSCASCHDPEHGYSDPAARSDDDVNRTRRHSQTLLDGSANPTAHWDGEFNSIEELVTARLGRPNGIKGVSAHGGASEFGLTITDPNLTSSDALGGSTSLSPSGRGGSSGGGYGSAGRTPADPTPPATAPQDPQPQNPKDPAPTTPTEDDASSDKSTSATTKTEKDKEAGSRATRLSKDHVRVLPVDVTRLPDVAETIEASGRYAEAFQAAFGAKAVTTARLAEAIAAYCRSIHSTAAPIDRWLAGDKAALSEAAQRGLALFRGRAGCVRCHVMEGAHPLFTDFQFHDTGIAWHALQRNVKTGGAEVDADRVPHADKGRETFTTQSADRRAFKTATLRDLPRRGPYMHDGTFGDLATVVRYYAGGASKDDHQDPRLKPFRVSDEEVADLVAFLESLNGEERPGLAPRVWHARVERTRLKLVDGRQQPLAGLTVTLVAEGDVVPGGGERSAASREVLTDAEGWCEFTPGPRTHTRLVLPGSVMPKGGALVPDSCARAVVEVPVDGRVTLVVAFEKGAISPEHLVAEHELTMRLPGHGAPRTLLERTAVRTLDAREVATYEGWLRTDLPTDVIVRLPGDQRARIEHRLKLSDQRTLRLDLGE